MSVFESGWYSRALKVQAHSGRVGGTIQPGTIVVHTTDCYPGSMSAIVRSWSTSPGNGACAHFLIGRAPADGVVQMVPINRNGNHAGGAKPGHYRVGDLLVHPNKIAVGIELDNAGVLKKASAKWLHPDTGREIPAADVEIDQRGRGWHKVNAYQYEQLQQLITALRTELHPLPGLTVVPNDDYVANGVPWAAMADARIVGHVTLDPRNKTDPGPFVLDWVRKTFART